jgi:hypothetical protein
MKNLYNFVKMNGTSMCNSLRKAIPALGIAAFFTFGASQTQAQTAMSWTGTENDRFTNENNWDPAGSPAGNDVTLPLKAKIYNEDSTIVTYNGVQPVLSGSENVAVRYYTCATDNDNQAMRPLIVNLENDAWFTANGNGNTVYYPGAIIVNSGNVHLNNSIRTENSNCFMEVNGGSLTWSSGSRQTTYGNNSANHNVGVQFRVNGGKLILNSTGHLRTPFLREGGFIIIKNDGVVTVRGNAGFPTQAAGTIPVQTLIDEHRSIHGGDDFYPVASYDAVTNITTIKVVPMATVMFRDNSTTEVMLGETAPMLNLVLTNPVRNAQKIEWKYRKAGQTTFSSFADADSTAFAPSFSEAGTFYVVAEVTSEGSTSVQTSEVTYSVLSDDVTISPAFKVQYIRVGEAGTKITASFKGGKVPTAMEWKYASAIGGEYVSFEPKQLAATINPVFNLDSAATGKTYYMILEATIDGMKFSSPNIPYVVEHQSVMGKALTWTGAFSSDAKDQANWNPIANPFKNNITVNALTGDAPNYPVFTMMGNDTINSMTINAGATLTLMQGREGVIDTMNYRNDLYVNGEIIVDDVMVDYTSYFWRLPVGTSKMKMTGEASLSIMADYNGGASLLSMGNSNTPNQGGFIEMKDNSRLYMRAFHRMVTSPNDSSVISLADNAQIWFKGDGRATMKPFIDSLKIRCAAEGYVPYALYDGEWTIVKPRNANAFSIANDEKVFTTVNAAVEEAITLTNVSGVTSWEWKYSNSINGPWVAFDPAQKDVAEFKPMFTEGGLFYVVAQTATGEITSNLKPIEVIALQIAPAIAQRLPINTNGDTLSFSMPEGVTFVEGVWMILDADGNETNTGVSDSIYVPTFAQPGLYQVLYSMRVNDEFGVGYILLSNIVVFDVYIVGVDNFAASQLKMYPNPSKGVFYVNGGQTEYNVSILSLDGKVLHNQYFATGGEQAVHFNQKGVYLVKLTAEGQVKVGRLIVK